MSSQTSSEGVVVSSHFIAHEHPSEVFRSSISPDGSVAASCAYGMYAKVVYCHGPRKEQSFHIPVPQVCDLSVSANGIATASKVDDCHQINIWQPPDFTHATFCLRSGSIPGLGTCKATRCTLTRNGSILVASFTDLVFSHIVVFDVASNQRRHHCVVEGRASLLCPEAEGAFVFFCARTRRKLPQSDSTERAISINRLDTTSGAILDLAIGLNYDPRGYLPYVCADAKGERLFVADRASLRMWFSTDNSIVKLPDYAPPEAPDCAVTSQGDLLVCALAGSSFGVWDTRRCMRIATLRAHRDAPVLMGGGGACAISDDGKTIVTGSDDKMMRVWTMPFIETTFANSAIPSFNFPSAKPSPVPRFDGKTKSMHSLAGPSSLELALATALMQPNALDMKMILENVYSANVKSASDLMAGHNLILLAIRYGVITRDNIGRLGGTQWYLQDNLYRPATKLVHESAASIDAVFLHAERVGIIEHGYTFSLFRESRADFSTQMASVNGVIMVLAECVEGLEHRLRATESNTANIGTAVNNIHSAVEGLHSAMHNLSLNQQESNRAVEGLASNLTQLQANIRKRDRRMKRASIARCMLSLVPLVGKVVGEAAYCATEILMNLKMEDLVPAGIDGVKHLVSEVAGNVDLSNFQVARHAFSSTTLSKFPATVGYFVHSAITKSSFESPAQLETILKQAIAEDGMEDGAMSFLDISSSEWMSRPPESVTEGVEKQWENKARLSFQLGTVEQDEDGAVFSLEEAKAELNRLLRDSSGMEEVSEERLECAFFEVADAHADLVNERIFVDMFLNICKEQKTKLQRQGLLAQYAERFRQRARPRNIVSLQMAARMIFSLSKELLKDGKITEDRMMEEDEILKRLGDYDADASESIDEDGFLRAAMELLHWS